jgi:hypothetical protein
MGRLQCTSDTTFHCGLPRSFSMLSRDVEGGAKRLGWALERRRSVTKQIVVYIQAGG